MTTCPLETNSVYPSTSESTRVLFIGEAPGEEEDKAGLPFVGKAGRSLRSWLKQFKLDSVAGFGNACLHRPYDVSPSGERINYNRVPTEQEMSACKPILDRFIRHHPPEVIVFVGGTSAKYLGGYKGTVGLMVGRWREYKLESDDPKLVTLGIPCTVIYHPSGLMRPLAKAKRAEMERMNFSVLREIAVSLGLLSSDKSTSGPCKECERPAEADGLCLAHLRGLALARIVTLGWPKVVMAGKVRSGLKWCGFLREASALELAELIKVCK